jgi:quinoprotein glucose dehydrogenase
LARISYKPEDLVTAADTNEAHAKACRELNEKLGGVYNDGPFSPWPYHKEGDPPRSLVSFPGGTGGANWGGTASDPRLGFVFVNTSDSGSVGWVEPKKSGVSYGRGTEASAQPVDRASPLGPGHYGRFTATFKDENGRNISWPCQKPPWGRLYAVNYNTGDIAWEAVLGITDELPEGKKSTGRYNVLGGPITTAGGLLFIGATDDRRFRAFDSKTGKELWVAELPASASSIPMTYQGKDGRQYVAVIADTLVSFALPQARD